MTTNVLVIGNGAREHALAWKLRASARVGDLYVAPGNPGTDALADNLPLAVMDFDGLAAAVHERQIGLVVVGPEGPLAAGLTDHLTRAEVAVFGPTQAAARIESSKSFAKRLMSEASIPTAAFRSFDQYEEAVAYLRAAGWPPVVKADGLAAGKGVTVARDLAEAIAAVRAAMLERSFGDAGGRVVLEERLQGREVSAHALSDGRLALPLPFACDHKAVRDGGLGPNTGGMGAFSPPPFMKPGLQTAIEETIVRPAITTLAELGMPYRGVLYPGLMLTEDGPRVVEFNCRFGDPETQVLLPRLRSDLFDALWGAATGDLSRVSLDWSPQVCVGVVLAAEGYPGVVRTGDAISGLEELDSDVLAFHAGTARGGDGQLVTAGGRVLTIVAMSDTIESARRRVYANVERVRFSGRHFRSDIGLEPAEPLDGRRSSNAGRGGAATYA